MIRVNHLSKYFKVSQPGTGVWDKVKSFFAPQHRIIKAVDDVTLEIERGSIVGYLGPNGAGKSTTIKLMTGILVPTSGSVQANGLEPYKSRVQNAHNVGVVLGQRTQLWWDLPRSIRSRSCRQTTRSRRPVIGTTWSLWWSSWTCKNFSTSRCAS